MTTLARSPEALGLVASESETLFENPGFRIGAKEFDSDELRIRAVNENGAIFSLQLIRCFTFRSCLENFFSKLELFQQNSETLTTCLTASPEECNHFDNSKEEIFKAANFSLAVLEPFRRWRVCYNGLMRSFPLSFLLQIWDPKKLFLFSEVKKLEKSFMFGWTQCWRKFGKLANLNIFFLNRFSLQLGRAIPAFWLENRLQHASFGYHGHRCKNRQNRRPPEHVVCMETWRKKFLSRACLYSFSSELLRGVDQYGALFGKVFVEQEDENKTQEQDLYLRGQTKHLSSRVDMKTIKLMMWCYLGLRRREKKCDAAKMKEGSLVCVTESGFHFTIEIGKYLGQR